MARTYDDTFPKSSAQGQVRRPQGAAAMGGGLTGRGTGRAQEETGEFVPAEFWINVGKKNPNLNDQGEVIGFTSLPGKGIALDQLKLPKANSNSPMMQAQLDLWNQVMAFAHKMEPGEVCEMPLTIQLRRVGQETTVVAADNAYAVSLFD